MVILFLSNPDMEEDEVEVTGGQNWRANSVSEYVLASLDLSSFTHGHIITPILRLELVVSSTPPMPGRRSNNYYWPLCDMYTYIVQGKEFIAFRINNRSNYFHMDVSARKLVEPSAIPSTGSTTYDRRLSFLFKPSFVMP
jgi:hypothetical protein